MSTSAGEKSLAEVAAETVVLEDSEAFLGLSRIDLGDTFADPGTRAFFGPVQQTQTVRSFTLRDTVLHAPTMLLFAGHHRVHETRYLVSDLTYDTAQVTDAEVLPASGDSPIVIGFNKDWWGYYHWLVQCLPAIDGAMRRAPDAAPRLALPRISGWHAEMLDLLGYGAVDRVEIDLDRCYALPRAVYSEHLNGSTAFGISRTAQQTFQRLRKRTRAAPSPNDAVYVARTDSPRRVMRNEEALIRVLESEGVAIVVPGTMSMADQIAVFSGAKLVIGAHGGGLSNIVFCPDDAAVYELLPNHYPNACFNRLAQAKGLDYWADMFPSDGLGEHHSHTWEIDLDLFQRRLAALRGSVRPAVPATAPRVAPASAPGELFSFYIGQAHSRPIHKWHHYFDIYERHLARFRTVRPTVVELGVEQGGALEMWRAYFGPECRLFGIDPAPDAKQYEDVATGIFVGDQRDPAFLGDVLREIGRPDVVINDGAHTAAQQIAAFELFYPALSENGVYIVEDTHTALWGATFMDRPDGQSFLGHAFMRCAELMSWTGNVENFEVLGTDRGVGLWNRASEFCRMTQEISFFDSMIVFERGRRTVPRHDRR
jgi:capsular polysaccharide biosynthesis protein